MRPLGRIASALATAVAGVLLIVSACSDESMFFEPDESGAPVRAPPFLISDGAHDGNENFYFLPPMVADPGATGTFDGSLSPVVQICEWDGSACATTIATYDMTTGPGSETVRVVPEDEHYIVNWHTDEFEVGQGPTYRISVHSAGVELGFADVELGETGKEAKNLTTDEMIGLKDGRTLPIKFRIEEGNLLPVVIAVSETITVTDANSLQPPVVIAVNETITVTDAPSMLPAILIAVNETITVTDVPRVVPPVVIRVDETITVTDAPETLPAVVINVLETITVTDVAHIS